jgi:protein-S-isoprenylcysteine O-methyltransferase Ste14
MNTVRYYAALLVLMALPPGLIFWFFIHPFARYWRRLGPVWTYAVLSLPTAGLMLLLFLLRQRLLAVEFGTNIPFIVLAAFLVVCAVIIQTKRRKYLTKAILTGIPELSQNQDAGKLLTEGIYGTIRHPRYVELWLFILAYSFFSNYLALYVAAILTVPTLYLVVLLEERELNERFGGAYAEYCDRVPRFLPRRLGGADPSPG